MRELHYMAMIGLCFATAVLVFKVFLKHLFTAFYCLE